jgi:DNA polymerase IV
MDARKILHIDMDAFYPAVEVLDRPELAGAALIVGGRPESRGVVSSASYEARTFGVRSAMATALAYKLCPHAVFLLPNMARYREVSQQIHAIFQQYTDLIEPISLDEAWLDVTENFQQIPSATWIAQRIKQQIRADIGLTCSAGVSFNKFLAKIASEEDKPDGLFVITPQSAPEFLRRLAVRKIPGVGRVTQAKLKTLGIEFGHHLLAQSEQTLVDHFGKMGAYLYAIIRGQDDRPVVAERACKSISAENTFAIDLGDGAELQAELRQICADLATRLEKHGLFGKTLTLKVKFHDFQQITRSITRLQDFESEAEIFAAAHDKLRAVCAEEFPEKPIRLLGVGISNFAREDNADRSRTPQQLELFPTRYF